GQGRGHADVLAVGDDIDVQVRVAGVGAGPGVGLARPLQVGGDLEVLAAAVGVHVGVGDGPWHSLVEDGLGAGVAGHLVELGDALHVPHLEAEPVVGRRVVPHRLPVVVHAVELRQAGRRGAVVALPAVGGATGDTALGGLQPLEELQLAVEAGLPVVDAGRGGGLQLGHLRQGVGGEHVLVALVGGAGADAPGPRGVGVERAAPGVVPGQQVVRAVLAAAGRAGGRADAVADLLEV